MNIEQLAEQTRIKSKSALFALIGLILSPLAVVAHAPVSPTDSVHSYAPFDYEQWRREHPRPAGKRLADLNVGEPRTVRMIYFLPNDRPYRQGVVDEMKAMIRRVQTFFAEQMQAHGYGNTTFRFETDAQGEPLVHRVDGQYPERHYNDNPTVTEVLDEIYFGEGPLQFDVLANDYLIVIDNSTGTIDTNGFKAGGVNNDLGKQGGISLVPSNLYFSTVAHELGHTFGLYHDFRDDEYIMSYGGDPDQLSACAAKFLSVNPYFNSDISLGEKWMFHSTSGLSAPGGNSIVEMITPADYPAESTKVSVQIKVSDADGIHQVLLFDTPQERGRTGLISCRGLAGEKDTVVELEYDVPISSSYNLIHVHVVDTDGEVTKDTVTLTRTPSYQVAALRHTAEVREISFSPDGTLIASATARGVWLWDTASRQQTASLTEGWGSSVSFSPDGTLLAAGTGDTALLWDTTNWQQVAAFRHTAEVREISFSPDGTLIATITGRGYPGDMVWLWDVASRQQTASLRYTGNREQWASAVSFSPDGTLLATAGTGDTALLWDTTNWQQVAAFRHTGDVNWDWDWVHEVSFSPDGTLLASATTDGGVRLWDVASKQQIAILTGHETTAWVSFSPDGTLLASGSWDDTIRLWDIASRQQTAVFESGANTVSFSPDGTLLASGGSDGTIRLLAVSEWTGSSGQVITGVEEEETIDEEAIPHSLTKVSGNGQGGQAGEPLAKPFVVSVLDQNGAAFAGAVVAFSVTAGGGMLSATTATTDASGRARTTLTLGNDAGTNTVAATVAGLGTVTFTATAIKQTPHSLTKVSGDGQQGQAGEQLAKPFVVSVLDQNGAAFAGASVTFSVTAGGGTLSATTATTDAKGRAATRLTLGNDAGTNTVTATVEGLEPVTFTATAITPHSLTKVSGDGQQGQAGEQLAKPFVVLVLDEDDAAIAGAVITFTVTAGGGTMSSTTAITSPHGRAARTLTLGSQPGTNTVDVSVAGLDPVTFTATAVGEESSFDLFDLFNQSGKRAALPDRTQLLQNAPNPFNSQTVVSYFLLETGPVRLEVFALSGQRIAVLDHGLQQAGYHRLYWDGRDATGRSVASGTYLYRLVTDEVVLTRKLVLLR